MSAQSSDEPVAVARVESQVAAVAVGEARGEFGVFFRGADDAAGGIDGGRDAVVCGAKNPAGVFGGAHAHDLQVLVARLAFAEPAVVRDVEENLGAGCGELPDVAREDGFVADEDAFAVRTERGYDDALSGGEIAGLGGDFAGDESEGPGDEFAERYEIHFVVAADGAAVRIHEQGGVQRGAGWRVGDDSGEHRGMSRFRDGGGEVQEAGIGVIERRGRFGPDDDVGLWRVAESRADRE